MQRKKLTRKEKAALQKPLVEAKQVQQSALLSQKKITWTLGIIIAAIGFLLYANTLNYDYVLDDYSVIKENRLTRQGWDAFPEIFKKSYRFGYYFVNDELYRPIPKAMFAAEWALAPDNPSLGHWINVLLYAFTGLILFFTLKKYFSQNLIIPFAATVLFIAHPIHTEVVANIKSRDEILSLLFVLLSMNFIHDYLSKEKLRSIFFVMIFFLGSLLSKESGVTFFAIFPLAVYFFTDASAKKNMKVLLWMLIPVAIFLLLRKNILENNLKTSFAVADNLLMAAPDFAGRFATAVFILGIYLKLLFFPHPLVFDYSFKQIPVVDVTDWRFLISLLIYAALLVFAIIKFKKKDKIAFSILCFLIALSIFSNIFIIIGTSFGERLMYLPSLGFCIGIAVILSRIFKTNSNDQNNSLLVFIKNNVKLLAVVTVIFVLYSFKTVTRNKAWKNNFTLFSNDVKLSPNSTRTHYYLGNYLTKPENIGVNPKDSVRMNAVLDSGIVELKRAIEIHPKFCDVYKQLGVAYGKKKDLKASFDYYSKAIECNPTDAPTHSNIGTVYFEMGNYSDALKAFNKAVLLDPNYTEALANLGSCYGMMKDYDNSLIYLHRCIKSDPGYAQAYYFLSITYGFKGDKQNADFYMNKFNSLKGE